ncbi:putative peptidylprolyl isomerase [Helianthus debilis subsp. tardiflorus]
MFYNLVKLLLLYRRQNIDKFEIWVTVDFLVLTYAFWDTLTFWPNIDLSTTNGIAESLLYGLHFDSALMELWHEGIFSMANLSPPTTCTPHLDGPQVVFGRAIKGIGVICSIAHSTNFDVIIAVCGCISKGTDETLRLHVSVMIVPFNWPQFPYNKVKFLVRAITSFDALYGHKPPTIPCSIYDSSGIANYEAPMLDEIASLLNPFTSLHLEDKVYFKGRGNVMNPPNQQAQPTSPLRGPT